MIFTAYIDELGTHGRDPTVVMGAFLGHAYQWRIFNRDLDRIENVTDLKFFMRRTLRRFAGNLRIGAKSNAFA